MHEHSEEHELITSILLQLAVKEKKSLERIERLLFVKRNRAIHRKFWRLINTMIPKYANHYIGYCTDCGALRFSEEPPC